MYLLQCIWKFILKTELQNLLQDQTNSLALATAIKLQNNRPLQAHTSWGKFCWIYAWGNTLNCGHVSSHKIYHLSTSPVILHCQHVIYLENNICHFQLNLIFWSSNGEEVINYRIAQYLYIYGLQLIDDEDIGAALAKLMIGDSALCRGE